MSPQIRSPLSSSILLILAFLSFFFLPSRSAVISIDLGSEWMKVAVVNIKPGQSPIAIAINEMSKRKSPALVAFSNGDMLVGEAAAGIVARYPERVYSQLHHLVGKPLSSVKEFLSSAYLPYDVVEDERGAVGFRIDDGESIFSSEELLALLLGYAKSLAESHAKITIKDAVIAVPPYLGQTERESIIVAAELGGLNVLTLINQHSGVALQYGITKDFAEEPKHVLFYDMGSSGAYAALVSYSAYTTKEFGKNKSVNQFQVRDVSWDTSVGGYKMELRLLEYFVDLFNKEIGGGVDIRNFPKALAKLKKQVKRTKEILSANTEAMLSVEGLHDDRDFRSTITRKKFEELCEDLWENALLPIKNVLSSTGISIDQLHAVELIGGATRVPKLQAVLGDYFSQRGLDRHLDADEAVALGAALHAANLSDGIKMNRKLGMIDGVTYSILTKIENAVGSEAADPEDVTYDVVVPRLKKIPSKVLKSVRNNQDFKFSLFYDKAEILPPGVSSHEIATYQISGVSDAFSKHGSKNLSSPIKTNLHFSLSRSGVLSIDKAETVVEFSEWIEVPVKNASVNKTNVESDVSQEADANINKTGDANSVDGQNLTETLGTTTEAENQILTEKKLRKRTIRVPLKVKDVTLGLVRPMSKDSRSEAANRLDKINRQEEEKRKTAEAKNSLESYIYMMQEKLVSEDGLQKVTTEEQRNQFQEQLSAAEDWLYTEETTASEYKKKLDALKSYGDSMIFRLTELKARPSAVDLAVKYVESIKEQVDAWAKSKPWISELSKNEFLDSVNVFKQWLSDKQKEQQGKLAHEVPVFSSEDVYSKVSRLEEKFTKLKKTAKPKPEVEKKASSKANESSSTTSEGEESTQNTAEADNATEEPVREEEEVKEEHVKEDIEEHIKEDVTEHDEL